MRSNIFRLLFPRYGHSKSQGGQSKSNIWGALPGRTKSSATGARQSFDVFAPYQWATLLGNWETRRNSKHSRAFQNLLRKSKACLSVSPSGTSHHFCTESMSGRRGKILSRKTRPPLHQCKSKVIQVIPGWFRLEKPRPNFDLISQQDTYLQEEFWGRALMCSSALPSPGAAGIRSFHVSLLEVEGRDGDRREKKNSFFFFFCEE